MRQHWPFCRVAIWFAFALVAIALASRDTLAEDALLLEAEQFDVGGWVVDQQFMDQMGSPYLLAHGLGQPVGDAKIEATLPASGRYRVWVRTRDWVAPWNVPGTPGRFQVLIDGKALETPFGVEGADWHWQDGGLVDLSQKATVALHDLTGFEGRCDAVLFCRNLDFRPPDNGDALAAFRRRLGGLPEEPEEGGPFDLVVVGGGIAGTCAALSAARLGLTVALVQDRPVLGGNGSSEVRVGPGGHMNQQPYPRIGDLVAELVMPKEKCGGNAKLAEAYADEKKLAAVQAEPKIKLLLGYRVNRVETTDGQIEAVFAQDIRTAKRWRLSASWFADCTGDGVVGYLAGADYEMTPRQHMGASNLWRVDDGRSPEAPLPCLCKDHAPLDVHVVAEEDPVTFPACPWAIDLRDRPFPGRKDFVAQGTKPGLENLGDWFWESGFDKDPIEDAEWIRDLNFRAMYGAWDVLKNVDHRYPNHRLVWAAFLAGKRESRRLLGDVVLSADDFRTGRQYPDGSFPCTWSIDLHSPDEAYRNGNDGNDFISWATYDAEGYVYQKPYWAPYRCLYSRNVNNLFMAGRDISVTHEGLGPVRVMHTCGMMGEIVGMAAAVCKQHTCQPRDVYQRYLAELKELMTKGCGRTAEATP